MKFFLFVLSLVPSLSFADANTDKLKYYLNESSVALSSKDYSFACELMREALTYARVAEGGKYLSTVQQTANTTCNKAEKSAVQGYNQIVQSHPYFKHCPAFRKAKNECATAGNYGNCMTIKFSVEYQNFENSGICY